jgi:glycosyltransferase involved in cell wall biosynthesis
MKQPVNLLVIGDGELLDQMRTESRGITAHFQGFTNQAAMPAWLGLADILVLPSSQEAWGLIVNEALAAGLFPVVSDAVGCAPDLVEDVGEVFPSGDIAAFANALDRAVSRLPNSEWRRRADLRLSEYSVANTVKGFIGAVRAVTQGQHEGKPTR